jgi:GST-like protein
MERISAAKLKMASRKFVSGRGRDFANAIAFYIERSRMQQYDSAGAVYPVFRCPRYLQTVEEKSMIRFYFHPTPNPAKIALFLEEAGLAYEVIPVDTGKGEQHAPAFRAINPNGKVPAIVDTEGPGGKEARVFDSSAILLYLGDKIGRFIGRSTDRPELLSWLFFIGTGLGPFSGQAVHFQYAAPDNLAYAVNRYRREVERHYRVLDDHLAGRDYIVGDDYSIVDMSAWGWLDRAPRVLKGEDDPFAVYPNIKRWFRAIDARPAVVRARAVGKNHAFKTVDDEEKRRSLYPSNYPPAP